MHISIFLLLNTLCSMPNEPYNSKKIHSHHNYTPDDQKFSTNNSTRYNSKKIPSYHNYTPDDQKFSTNNSTRTLENTKKNTDLYDRNSTNHNQTLALEVEARTTVYGDLNFSNKKIFFFFIANLIIPLIFLSLPSFLYNNKEEKFLYVKIISSIYIAESIILFLIFLINKPLISEFIWYYKYFISSKILVDKP